MFMPRQVQTVAATNDPVDRARLRIDCAKVFNSPVLSMIHPKLRAHRTKEIVFIMLSNPPCESSASTASLPVFET